MPPVEKMMIKKKRACRAQALVKCTLLGQDEILEKEESGIMKDL